MEEVTVQRKVHHPIVKAFIGKANSSESGSVLQKVTTLPTNGKSKQSKDDGLYFNYEELVEPPYQLNILASFLEISTWHAKCVSAKAKSTVQLGYYFTPPEGKKKGNDSGKDTLQEFFRTSNCDMPFDEMLYNVFVDYYGLGNGYIEVVRNVTNKITSLYHAAGTTIRVRKNRKGFCQVRDTKKVYFKNFDDKEIMDKETGEYVEKGKTIDFEKQASELIHLIDYSPRSSYYGIPDWVGAITAILGSRKAAEWNIMFFENDAVPRVAIIVEGGELGKDAKSTIQKYFQQELKGESHRTLLLESDDPDVKIKIDKLMTEITDASFSKYRQENRDEIIAAHQVPPKILGIESSGGVGGDGEGVSQQSVFRNQVITPEQNKLEFILNGKIIRGELNIEDWEIRFKKLEITDEKGNAGIVDKTRKTGALTVNEIRAMLSLPPIEEAKGGELRLIEVAGMPIRLETLVGKDIPYPVKSTQKSEGETLVESLMSLQDVLRKQIEKRVNVG